MRNLYTIVLLLYLSFMVSAQKNYPIVSIDDCLNLSLINDEPMAIAIINNGERNQLAFYHIEEKKCLQTFNAPLPDKKITQLLPCDDGMIYILTAKQKEGQRRPLFDAIYAFSYKKDRIVRVYEETEDITMPSAALVRIKMYLSGNPFTKQPRVFNVQTKCFEPFSEDANLRLLFASDANKACIVMRESELSDDDTCPVYCRNEAGQISEQIGTYDSRMVMSTKKDENRMPGLTISNADYNWAKAAYDQTGFPHSGFSIATRPGLADYYSSLANRDELRTLLGMNSTYLAAKGKGKVFFYNVKEPCTQKPQTVSDEMMAGIKEHYNNLTSYIKTKLQSNALNEVFDACFYSITEQIHMDEYSRMEDHFIAFSHNGQYDVLKTEAQLLELIPPQFTIANEQDAILFQDALNTLYPPGTFAQKHIQCIQQEGQWLFVRDESFGDKKGYIVSLNADSHIMNIEKANKLPL
ncbi:hypothetical protein J1N10_06425 [Carboxylicivirga sp. A043]|uniref:hypothetical protein n=1 Tax=Carboxylicivirga litoralis TaxID=2816963 RepID=UPI0021CB19A0|nr:hypothetical protein [Carboxylicivirga sp. A043]MCU4155605.1 hypothetical protein [Carboxylicivirga sp. A043]